ncbi:hypothetical protein BGZ94_004431 [Podila epigama]|nr:hypothetical protein BGZ94_004431 [Podila epigama]
MGSCLSTPGLSGGNTVYQNAPPPPAFPVPRSYDLPPGWICQYDPQSQHLFYVNTTTGARQWEHPKGATFTTNDATQFREQLNLYNANMQSHNSRYGGGAAGAPPGMSQPYNPGRGSMGGRGGMGSMAKGGMLGLLAGSLLGGGMNRSPFGGGGGGRAYDHSNDPGGGFFGGSDGYGGGADYGGGGGGGFFNQDGGGYGGGSDLFGGGGGGSSGFFGGGGGGSSDFFGGGGGSSFFDQGSTSFSGGGGGGFFDQ